MELPLVVHHVLERLHSSVVGILQPTPVWREDARRLLPRTRDRLT